VAIAGGDCHSLALRANGSIVGWAGIGMVRLHPQAETILCLLLPVEPIVLHYERMARLPGGEKMIVVSPPPGRE